MRGSTVSDLHVRLVDAPIIQENGTSSTRPSRKGGAMIEEARKALEEARAAMDTGVGDGKSAPNSRYYLQ